MVENKKVEHEMLYKVMKKYNINPEKAEPRKNLGTEVIKEILLPDLGEGIEGAEVSEVSVSIGSVVQKEDTILVLESDKASMEIPAEISGVVQEILVEPGDEVTTGQSLIKINESKEKELPSKDEPLKVEERRTEAPKTFPEKSIKEPQLEKNNKISKGVFASPGVRKLSRELEINLRLIKGTGSKGRITKEDLHGYIKANVNLFSENNACQKRSGFFTMGRR